MKFLIATKNKHKIAEFSAIFSALSLELISEKDLDKPLTEAEENGNTFEENALIKARTAAAETGLPTIADDSGLCVDVLGGEPGIYSARYAGEH
ncbi:MAG: non-canonical purine NTP pyrophosphatase, partial [Clostridia bacterium]|nr:non-canonical purine NTP pyrophosphatase [Clostridia bacterium]